MSQSLRIALLQRDPGWEILLDWIGAPWRIVHSLSDLEPSEFVLVIVNRHLWKEEIDAVDAFVRSGGALLDTYRFCRAIRPWQYRRSFAFHFSLTDSECSSVGFPLVDIDCRIEHGVGERPVESITRLIAHGNGVMTCLGFDPGPIYSDFTTRFRHFPGVDGKRPIERVSRLGKGQLGQLVLTLVRNLFQACGIPLVRKRPFPGDARSIFAFRIDTDYGSREEIDTLANLADNARVPFTWFVHTGAHRDWLERFVGLSNDEVAVHGERHRTFKSVEENLRNMLVAREQLQAVGVRPNGFAAPTGAWNHQLAQAIDTAGFSYSSEFALAWSGFPFRPILPVDNQINRYTYDATQVPIHPISIGHLARARFSEAESASYFRETAQQMVRAELPVIYYHHPTHRRWAIVEEVLKIPEHLALPTVRFEEWVDFRSRRTDCWFDARLSEHRIAIEIIAGEGYDDIWLEVDTPHGSQLVSPMKSTLQPQELSHSSDSIATGTDALSPENRDGRIQVGAKRLRGFSTRLIRRAVLDFVTKVRR